jgi:plastocyanin
MMLVNGKGWFIVRRLVATSLVAIALGMVAALPAGATTHLVIVGVPTNAFDPAVLTIQVGDTVRWENRAGNHNVWALDGSFSSGPVSSDAWTYLHTFTSAGTWNYLCVQHANVMKGTIIVEPADEPSEEPTSAPTKPTPTELTEPTSAPTHTEPSTSGTTVGPTSSSPPAPPASPDRPGGPDTPSTGGTSSDGVRPPVGEGGSTDISTGSGDGTPPPSSAGSTASERDEATVLGQRLEHDGIALDESASTSAAADPSSSARTALGAGLALALLAGIGTRATILLRRRLHED